jgi:hypothetical protein
MERQAVTFIRTIPTAEATGLLKELYATYQELEPALREALTVGRALPP